MAEISIAIYDDLESERIGLARMVQSYAKAHDRTIQLRLFSSGESLLAEPWSGSTISTVAVELSVITVEPTTWSRPSAAITQSHC